jgi:hypothetical protein
VTVCRIVCCLYPRLASGDADGGVVVWDVGAACPAARLEEVPSARDIMRDYRARTSSDGGAPGGSGSLFPQAQGGGAGGGGATTAAAAVGVAAGSGVPSLAWVMPGSHVLAVVLAPALLLLWDTNSEWGRAVGQVLRVQGRVWVQVVWGMCVRVGTCSDPYFRLSQIIGEEG